MTCPSRFDQTLRIDVLTQRSLADAIIATNFAGFLHILARPGQAGHGDLSPEFVALILDRLLQHPPPHLDDRAKINLRYAVFEYTQPEGPTPELLSTLYLIYLMAENNHLIEYIKAIGVSFTADENNCRGYLQNAKNSISLDESVVSQALRYVTISLSPVFSPSVFVAALQKEVSPSFSWTHVVGHFDTPELRVSPRQLLSLYNALRPLALDRDNPSLDIECLWGGPWQNSETAISFVTSFISLDPGDLDATTIPGFECAIVPSDYAGAGEAIEQRAKEAVHYTITSAPAMRAIFQHILNSQEEAAMRTTEATRFFAEVLSKVDFFIVACFSVERPWGHWANITLGQLFERFVFEPVTLNTDFVMTSLWRMDKMWVSQKLAEIYEKSPLCIPKLLELAVRYQWLQTLVGITSHPIGFEIGAAAHAQGYIDTEEMVESHRTSHREADPVLLSFLMRKANHEVAYQRNETEEPMSNPLPVKTVWALLQLLDGKLPTPELTLVQRSCITAYPRLINYGEGYDDIIDANGKDTNGLPPEANARMEEHYKRMYSDDLQVRSVVDALLEYKHSRDSLDQDIFACMIHGLFDEYPLYTTYPLEALATTAVLFGGIIAHKLIDHLPLETGLGMILDSVREPPDSNMFKFGLQALLQLFPRLREWPGFCRRLLEIPGLQGTEAWVKAQEVAATSTEDAVQNENIDINGRGLPNGSVDSVDAGMPPFTSINVDPIDESKYEEPSEDTQEKVLFVLNNLSQDNLKIKFKQLQEVVEEKHQNWFATHLVEERAKREPNFHDLYLNILELFERKSLWADVLRQTYISSFRLLNAEATLTNQNERRFLGHLGTWLGYLTLARDKPVKHKNIAVKPLLMEAYESQRMIVVFPFVTKILAGGAKSFIFKPPNPWLMDILRLLASFYHYGDLKLNLKFDFEITCNKLGIDHHTVEPLTDALGPRTAPSIDEPRMDPATTDALERFDNLSLNGMGGGVNSGRFSPSEIITSLPDLGPLLQYPPTNDLVNQPRLQEIVRTAITRAVQEIIAPVVERSVTIAAISTAQMVHKDFATEPDEGRLRAAAVAMVKRTAGALALVTSKEPLRASMGNYIRTMSQEMAQALPEGTIIMCVNSNLEMACSQVEKKAEERAVPEIEELIETEIQSRRHHRLTRPNEPYVDPGLSRWALTIPHPYKLLPNTLEGLNNQQMAIYDEFARPRAPTGLAGHGPSTSDATRSMADNIGALQEQYAAVPNMPTPAETPPALHQLSSQQIYSQPIGSMVNGRAPQLAAAPDARNEAERIEGLLSELIRTAEAAPEQHYAELPRAHPIIDLCDALITQILASTRSNMSEDIARNTGLAILRFLFPPVDNNLAVETLVHVLDNLCSLPGRVALRPVVLSLRGQPDEAFLHPLLIPAMMKSELPLLEWERVDRAFSRAIQQRKEEFVTMLSTVMDQVLLNDRPIALRADFACSLEALAQWMQEDPNLEIGKQIYAKLRASGIPAVAANENEERMVVPPHQLGYIFEEWVHLCSNSNATEKSMVAFILQLHDRQFISDMADSMNFFRVCIDSCIDRFEQSGQPDLNISGAYLFTDCLGQLIARLVRDQGLRNGEVKGNKAAYLKSMLSVVAFVLNHHHVMRGERFNQRVFFRLFSVVMGEVVAFTGDLPDSDKTQITLVFAEIMRMLQPAHFPGFTYGWVCLLAHRDFMPRLLRLPDQMGWEPFISLLESLILYLGEQLKPLHLSPVTRDLYRAVLKMLAVLQHDFPEVLAANHVRLCAAIPIHCVQLQNMVLVANPSAFTKVPDPVEPGLKVDRLNEIREHPPMSSDIEQPLREKGLLELLEQVLLSGPSEDAVAHVAHEILRKDSQETGAGFIPINVDTKLIDALVVTTGVTAIKKAAQKGGPTFASGSPDIALLTMLVHEINDEARYYFLNSIVNQLRYPNAHTHYFSQALLEIFGTDINDQEEIDIKQQVIRILLERSMGHWPQPWGLMITIVELVKNDKYHFFDLPFLKNMPEVSLFFKQHIRNRR